MRTVFKMKVKHKEGGGLHLGGMFGGSGGGDGGGLGGGEGLHILKM